MDWLLVARNVTVKSTDFFFTLQHADKHKNLMRKINFYHCPNAVSTVTKARARGYKTFFLLNSAEHEILNALKYKNVKKVSIFQDQINLECYFSCS